MKSKWLILGAAAMLALAVGAFLIPTEAEAPAEAPAREASAADVRLETDSELLQTLTYTRCEHTVTRRVTAPTELHGKTLQEVSALYPEWKVTEFSPALVRMEQKPDMFCPDHMVVMPGGAGYLCVFENRYGDALALVRELEVEVAALPAAVQEEGARGIGFATAEELDLWLEGVES